MRASDADRERVAELLHEAVTDGRLTLEEHAERIEAVYRARTLGELTAFTRDLLPAEQQPFKVDAQNLVALFGSQRREGRWVVPARPVAAPGCTMWVPLGTFRSRAPWAMRSMTGIGART